MSKTSLAVFRSFLTFSSSSGANEDDVVDASQITSKACYQAWLLAQRKFEEHASDPKKFHRALTNHVSGVDGRHPFEAGEEAAILCELRKKSPWPCFPHAAIGWGYRGKGYHEKLSMMVATTAPSLPSQIEGKRPKLMMVNEDGQPTSQDFVKSFAEKVAQYSTQIQVIGAEEWQQLSEILRFVVLSKITAARGEPPSPKTLQQLLNRFGKAETVGVSISDVTKKSFDDRIVAQNSTSLTQFGNLMGAHNRAITLAEELNKVVVAVLQCISHVGESFQVSQAMRTVTGAVHKFNTTYTMDPETHCIVFTAQLADEKY
ncbi:hypothetical protein BASA81_007116 [Batrachochytrium salamandrivorans]|nr:hypothetical protein BASA81_007116 [Batrachochytrium salamandrivorans]